MMGETLLMEKDNKGLLLGLVCLGVIIGFSVAELNTPYTTLIAILAGLTTIAVFFYPQVGVVVSIFIIWLEHGLVNYTPALTLTKMVVLLTGLSLIINFVLKKLQWRPVKINLPLIIFLLLMLVSVFYSPNPQNGLHKLSTFVTQIAFVYLVVQTIRTPRWISIIFGGLVLISLYQAIQSFSVMKAVNVHEEIVRLSGNYQDPNVFARGLLISLTICLLFLILNKNLWLRLLSLGASMLFMGAIFFTGSRSSVIISLMVIMFIIVLLMRTQGFSLGRLVKQVLFAFLVVAINLGTGYLLIDNVPVAYTQRILNMVNKGFAQTVAHDGRALLYYAAADTIAQKPILGVGLSGFRAYIGGIAGSYPHNIFLEIWAEVGILGLLALVMLLFIPYWAIYKGLLKNRGDPETYILTFMVLVGYVINLSYAQFIGQITSHKPLWVFMGLLLALDQINLAKMQGGDLVAQNLSNNHSTSG